MIVKKIISAILSLFAITILSIAAYLIPLANESNDEGYNGYVVLDVIKI